MFTSQKKTLHRLGAESFCFWGVLLQEREKSHDARSLDGLFQLLLVAERCSGIVARLDSTKTVNEPAEHFHVLVVDILDLVDREVALFFLRLHKK